MSDANPQPIIFLPGDRLYLRPPAMDDLATLQRWVNDPNTRGTMATYLPISEVAERKWIEACADTSTDIKLVIVLRDGDRPVGCLGLRGINGKDRDAEFGITIGEADARGKGYGTEATKLFLAYAFELLNLHRVHLRVLSFNDRAIASYEKIGFHREGTLRESCFTRGVYQDQYIYSMLAQEYFALREKSK